VTFGALGYLDGEQIVWAIAFTAEAALEDATEEARICEVDPGTLRTVELTPEQVRLVGSGKFKVRDLGIDPRKVKP
jgi:hypothetical protein